MKGGWPAYTLLGEVRRPFKEGSDVMPVHGSPNGNLSPIHSPIDAGEPRQLSWSPPAGSGAGLAQDPLVAIVRIAHLPGSVT